MELDYYEIGQNVRKYRLICHLKQKELAEKLNVTSQHISHIENAQTKLSLPMLIAIANELSVDCNTLLGQTLTGSQRAIMNEELERLASGMEPEKLRIGIEIFRLLSSFNP